MAIVSLNRISEVIYKLEQLELQSGAVEDMKQLDRTTKRIQALVTSSEKMEIYDESTKLWIAELSEVLGEAQDLVDEVEYEIVRDQVEQKKDENLPNCRLMSAVSVVADKAKRIKERLNDICKSREELRLTSDDGIRRPDCCPKYPLTTTHMVNTSKIYGREDDKKNIVDWLLSKTNRNKLDVLSVVGKGGLGKTTVAQLVYNDYEVLKFFDRKIWICVSLDFDIVKLTREIVETVTKKSCNITQLWRLHKTLHEKLAGKRVLVVLDDVWNLHEYLWDSFKVPLSDGKQLVRIIVTTRNEKISNTMKGAKIYRLGYLPCDDGWKLFKNQAFHGRNSEEFPHLEDIGMKIVRKSGGLPLVVKSLGSILQDSTDEERWNEVLESRLWELEEEHAIMPILQLSYNYLPTYLKPCFLSCTVFPKDYELLKDEVVHLWISLGYIQNERRSLEDEGIAYFDELHKRSFFDVGKSFWHKRDIFKMHDSIHDLALHISDNCFSSSSFNYLQNAQSKRRARAVICGCSSSVDPSQYLKGNIKYLRYLDLNRVNRFPKHLPQLYNLHVLIITGFSFIELPQEFGDLISLLYLRLSISSLEYLPESICQLYNLETLDMSGSMMIRNLPSISNLCNLRNLILTNTSVDNLPVGFGELLNLERVDFYQKTSGPNVNVLRELKDLVNLQGHLCIFDINNIPNVEYAKEANLKNKPKIHELRLQWTNSSCCSRDSYDCRNDKHLHLTVPRKAFRQRNDASKTEEDVLDSLQPHTNLRSLTIIDYSGVRFPSWVGDSSFRRLTEIILSGCNVSFLPTLGQLPLLKWLDIMGLSNVQSIGREFLQNDGPPENNKVAFPSLLKLKFVDMCELKEWQGVQEQDFPKLQELRISSCPFIIITLPSRLNKILNW